MGSAEVDKITFYNISRKVYFFCGEPCSSAAQQEKTIQFHNFVIHFEASSSQDEIIAAYFRYIMSLKDYAVVTDDLGDFHPSQALQIDAMSKRTFLINQKSGRVYLIL